MGIFSKKAKNKALSDRQEAFAGKVAAAIVHRQTRIADFLNRKTAYWDRASKIIALLVFSLVFGGISCWLLIKAIY
jgi:hypothetical protein